LGKISQIPVLLIPIFLASSFVFSGQFASYAASSVDDWPVFRHDAFHTGFSSGKTPTSSVVQLWNYTLDVSSLSAPAYPVVADGLVYVGSADYSIYCFEGSTGEKVWSFATGGETDSSPAVIDGRVYVGSGDGYVYCLDALDGTQVWNHSVGVSINAPVNFVDGRVYVESQSGDVYCLDAVNGERVWSFSTGAEASSLSQAISDGYVFAANRNGDVFCLDSASGVHVWNFSTGGIVRAPSVAGGCVFAGSYDGNVYCLNASSGAEIWRVAAGVFSPVNAGGSAGSPVVADGVVYVVGNGVLSSWGSSSSDSTFPLFEVMLVVVLVIIAASVGVYVYSKRS
jgi:outer membrane protein assembly factor BamB